MEGILGCPGYFSGSAARICLGEVLTIYSLYEVNWLFFEAGKGFNPFNND